MALTRTDIAVIGGGALGLAIARQASTLGQVMVFERGCLGGEATRAAAGMIGPQSEALQDDAYFSATLAARDQWPNFSSALAQESGVDLGFHAKGAWHLAFGASYEKRLEAKYLWQKRRAGKVERLEGDALRQLYPYFSPRVSAAYFADGDYWVDNEKMADALALACQKRGVRVREHCPVLRLAPEGVAWQLTLADGEMIQATQVVVAAGAWSTELLKDLLPDNPAARSHPVKGQMLSFKVEARMLPALPIHAEQVYLVPRQDGRLLVGATVETVGFDKRLTGEGIEYLLQGAFETIPDLRNCEVDRLWAGLRPGAGDGWPTLGPSGRAGLHLALGAYRRGILLAPLVADALAHALQYGELPPAAVAFALDRRTHTAIA